MELSLREWLIIGGVIVIALIIIDGWRRMRSNRNTLRMQIDKSLVDLPDETHNPELPNGGFRVLDDPDHTDFVERELSDSLASDVESELPPEPSDEYTAEAAVELGELASEVSSEADFDDNIQPKFETVNQTLSNDDTEYTQQDFNTTGHDGLSAPRIVANTSEVTEESFVDDAFIDQPVVEDLPSEFIQTEPAFAEASKDDEVNFENLGDVRYAAEYDAQPELIAETQSPVSEAPATEAPVSFSAGNEDISDAQVISALDGSASKSNNSKDQRVANSAPAFDADSFAERDPLFEPLETVDEDLYDYDGVSASRVREESASTDMHYDTPETEAEPVYQFEEASRELQSEPVDSRPSHYQYDEEDIDDLSQGVEEFISPRLTKAVDDVDQGDDDQNSELDFEKPITELFGNGSAHTSGPMQATMDLGSNYSDPETRAELATAGSFSAEEPVIEELVIEDFVTEEAIVDDIAAEEMTVPASRYNADQDDTDDLSHAPLIGEAVYESEQLEEQSVIERQEPTFTDIEPEPMYIEPSMDIEEKTFDELSEEVAEPIQEANESVVAVPESKKRTVQAVPDADKVLVISVVTREEDGFNGRNLLQIVKACGMHFGEMQIFNRYEDGFDQGAIQFSMTNAMEPGIFDIDNMESLDTRGVTFFMSMEEPRDVMNAYECMLGTAEAVAKNLGGELLDENRSSMRTQTKEHYRERIRHFEMRKLKPQL